MIIAIDFDGTIAEDRYPDIGPPRIFAFETMQEMIKNRHQLILWTSRQGEELQAAVDFCREKGVDFYAVNKSYPEENFDPSEASRKIICDLFVSQKNFGGFSGWGEVWQEIKTGGDDQLVYGKNESESWLARLIKKFKGQ